MFHFLPWLSWHLWDLLPHTPHHHSPPVVYVSEAYQERDGLQWPQQHPPTHALPNMAVSDSCLPEPRSRVAGEAPVPLPFFLPPPPLPWSPAVAACELLLREDLTPLVTSTSMVSSQHSSVGLQRRHAYYQLTGRRGSSLTPSPPAPPPHMFLRALCLCPPPYNSHTPTAGIMATCSARFPLISWVTSHPCNLIGQEVGRGAACAVWERVC